MNPLVAKARSAREAILDAGRRVLLRTDYRASMDDVAAEAGVARRTVFNHFKSKEALFEEILLKSAADQLPSLTLRDSGDLRADLLDFATRYVRAITGEGVVSIYRMMPNAGPGARAKLAVLQNDNYLLLHGSLTDCFERHIEEGRLKPFRADFAAERLLSAAVGAGRVKVSLGIEPESQDREAYIADTIDAFLAAVRI